MGPEGCDFVRGAGGAGESGCLPGPWPIPNLGDAALCMHGPLGAAHWRAEKCFLPGACPCKKRILDYSAGCGRRKSATLPSRARGVGRRRWGSPIGAGPGGLLRRMERCGETAALALPGEGRWTEALGSPTGQDLAGCSVGRGAAEVCDACPPGRVHGTECIWEPYGANPEGLFRRMERCGETAACALPGESVGSERPAKVCDAFWVRCGNGFPAAGPCFRFGKKFFEVAAHLAGLIRYTG